MLQRVALSPARMAVNILGVLLVLVLLFFAPVPHFSSSWLGIYYTMSLLILFLVGGASLIALWKRGRLRLHESLLVASIGILVFYGTLIMWPTYESGIAWHVGDPKGSFEAYHVWYIHHNPLNATLSDFMIVPIMLGTLLAAWYVLLPLGIALLLSMGLRWSGMPLRRRWATLGVSVLAVAVPMLTWTASHQFLRWFLD